MAGLCWQLCEKSSTASPLAFHPTTCHFSLTTAGGGEGEGEGQGEGEREEEEEEVVDLDRSLELEEKSMSFGFSDSDEDVIEELSADEDVEEEEEVKGGADLDGGCGQEPSLEEEHVTESIDKLNLENGPSAEDSRIKQLKVSILAE